MKKWGVFGAILLGLLIVSTNVKADPTGDYTTFWFMDLPDPSFEQSGLISIVVGAGAAWFGLYTNSAKPKV